MRKYICNRYPENPPTYKKENCFHSYSELCNHDSKQCDATRYVRADVAIRYARMRERKAYALGIEYGYREDENEDGKTGVLYENTYEEAQQALQQKDKGEL